MDSNTSSQQNSNSEKVFLDKLFRYASGDWIPKSKNEEDEFFVECGNKIGKKKSDSIGEYALLKKVELLLKENNLDDKIKSHSKVSCDWIPGQSEIIPDLETSNFIFEAKTLRYFNCKGKRGEQGTAPEKLDSILRKYGMVYKKTKKKVLAVLIADHHNERHGKSWIDASKGIYHGNDMWAKNQMELCKNLNIKWVSFKELSLKHLIDDSDDEKLDEQSNLLNIENIAQALSGIKISKKSKKNKVLNVNV